MWERAYKSLLCWVPWLKPRWCPFWTPSIKADDKMHKGKGAGHPNSQCHGKGCPLSIRVLPDACCENGTQLYLLLITTSPRSQRSERSERSERPTRLAEESHSKLVMNEKWRKNSLPVKVPTVISWEWTSLPPYHKTKTIAPLRWEHRIVIRTQKCFIIKETKITGIKARNASQWLEKRGSEAIICCF